MKFAAIQVSLFILVNIRAKCDVNSQQNSLFVIRKNVILFSVPLFIIIF